MVFTPSSSVVTMSKMRLALLVVTAKESENERTASFRRRLNEDGRRQRRRRITRRALQQPRMSAFTTFFGSGCDQSLLTLCGFDHSAFRELIALFTPMYTAYSTYSSDGRI